MIDLPNKLLSCVFVLLLTPSLIPGQETASQTPPSQPPASSAPKPKPADSPDDREDFSIGLFGWFNPAHLHLRNGKGAVTTDNPATLDYPGKIQPTPGIEFSMPAGKLNALRISYLRTQGHGGATTAIPIKTFGQDFASGTVLSVKYKLQEAKVTWEYLSWPYPPENSSFRFKTLWGAQFISVKSTLNAPVFDAANGTDTTVFKTHWMILPTIGAGIEKRFSRAVRWELRGEGFMLPHRAYIWDAQSFIGIKASRIEMLIGGRALGFRTTPKKPEFVYATLPGGFLEVRWRFKNL